MGAVGCGADPREVAREAVEAFADFLGEHGGVQAHLADQVIVPLALAAAGLGGREPMVSRFTAERVTDALLAGASLVGRFLAVEVAVREGPGRSAWVRIGPRGVAQGVSREGLPDACRADDGSV